MKKILLVLLTAGFFAACQQKAVPAQDDSPNSTLESTRWKLTSLTNMPGRLPSLPKDVFLQLNAGKAAGFAGCNSFFGAYAAENSTLRFNGVGSTKMFCQDGMEVENNLLQTLGSADNYRITGKQLQLLKGNIVLAQFDAMAGS